MLVQQCFNNLTTLLFLGLRIITGHRCHSRYGWIVWEDKLTVARACKIQRFLSQPFQVAEVFMGHLDKLVKQETSKGFWSILAGRCHTHLSKNTLKWREISGILVVKISLSSLSRWIWFPARASFLHGGSHWRSSSEGWETGRGTFVICLWQTFLHISGAPNVQVYCVVVPFI